MYSEEWPHTVFESAPVRVADPVLLPDLLLGAFVLRPLVPYERESILKQPVSFPSQDSLSCLISLGADRLTAASSGRVGSGPRDFPGALFGSPPSSWCF